MSRSHQKPLRTRQHWGPAGYPASPKGWWGNPRTTQATPLSRASLGSPEAPHGCGHPEERQGCLPAVGPRMLLSAAGRKVYWPLEGPVPTGQESRGGGELESNSYQANGMRLWADIM